MRRPTHPTIYGKFKGKEKRKQAQLPITNYQLPNTHYQKIVLFDTW
ncbi:MAG: hypothetical protein HC894_24050 [Microcoleus sp. SM1_3_4]|nr:hypothetical protein [Microcoleus sp. SM1_3_4]